MTFSVMTFNTKNLFERLSIYDIWQNNTLSLCWVSHFIYCLVECCNAKFHYSECHYAECRYAEWLYAECHNAECHYAECLYAECRYSECHFAECCYAECHYAKCWGARETTPILLSCIYTSDLALDDVAVDADSDLKRWVSSFRKRITEWFGVCLEMNIYTPFASLPDLVYYYF